MFNNISLDSIVGHYDQKKCIEEYEMQKVNLEIATRLKTPLKINPEDATLQDIELHARYYQFLSTSTIEKNIRYAKFMMNHPCPLDLYHLEIEDFLQHMFYRLYTEIPPASPHSIRHELKAVQMIQRALGQKVWQSRVDLKLPPIPRSHNRMIPFPDIVREFLHYPYSSNRYTRKLYQYMFTVGFLIGPRIPSEICNLKTDDIVFNPNGTAHLTITEQKKRNSKRTIIIPKTLASHWRYKSLKNWLDNWRPKAETKLSKNYLFIQPNSGKPFTTRHLGYKLSSMGKKVWPTFQPYDMRHWCAIARLIEQKVTNNNWDKLPVKNWLGHENDNTTDNYIKHALQYYSVAPFSWIKHVLRPQKKKEEYEISNFLREDYTHNPTLLENLSQAGKTADRFSQQEKRRMGLKRFELFSRRKKTDQNPFFALIGFQPIKLNSSFFLFIFLGSPSFWRQGVGGKRFGEKNIFYGMHYVFSYLFCLLPLRFCLNIMLDSPALHKQGVGGSISGGNNFNGIGFCSCLCMLPLRFCYTIIFLESLSYMEEKVDSDDCFEQCSSPPLIFYFVFPSPPKKNSELLDDITFEEEDSNNKYKHDSIQFVYSQPSPHHHILKSQMRVDYCDKDVLDLVPLDIIRLIYQPSTLQSLESYHISATASSDNCSSCCSSDEAKMWMLYEYILNKILVECISKISKPNIASMLYQYKCNNDEYMEKQGRYPCYLSSMLVIFYPAYPKIKDFDTGLTDGTSYAYNYKNVCNPVEFKFVCIFLSVTDISKQIILGGETYFRS